MNEFAYRHNHRDDPDIFDAVLRDAEDAAHAEAASADEGRMTKPRKKKAGKKKRPPPRQLPPKEGRERLKPISLHGMEFDDILRRLVKAPP